MQISKLRNQIQEKTGKTVTTAQGRRLARAVDRVERSFWLPFGKIPGGFAEAEVADATKTKLVLSVKFGVKKSVEHKTQVSINRKTLGITA